MAADLLRLRHRCEFQVLMGEFASFFFSAFPALRSLVLQKNVVLLGRYYGTIISNFFMRASSGSYRDTISWNLIEIAS